MARIVIDKALSGDVVTARFCLDRLEPRPRGRAIAIDLPEGARMRDVVAAFDATIRAMAGGEITPDEAVQVTRVLDRRRKAIEAAWREGEAETKPSPTGRGLGEGFGHTFGDDRAAVRRPHPDPPERLSKGPRGEGIVRGARSVGGSFPTERGAAVIANLLHSTCISTPSGAMGWVGAGAVAGSA